MPATVLFLECQSYVIVDIYVAVGCVVNSHFSLYIQQSKEQEMAKTVERVPCSRYCGMELCALNVIGALVSIPVRG